MPRKIRLPDMPAPTAAEEAASADLRAKMEQLADQLRRRNLDNAVLLAQQAARGEGPLVDHFAELGRRYVRELNRPRSPKLSVVGGIST